MDAENAFERSLICNEPCSSVRELGYAWQEFFGNQHLSIRSACEACSSRNEHYLGTRGRMDLLFVVWLVASLVLRYCRIEQEGSKRENARQVPLDYGSAGLQVAAHDDDARKVCSPSQILPTEMRQAWEAIY